VVAATRQRGGKAGSARGAASLVAQALGTAEQIRTPPIEAGETARHAQVLLRADSAFYTGTVISAVRRRGARFSVTVSMNPAVRRAIERFDESARIAIRYPNAVWDDGAGVWICEAELAEICYTPSPARNTRSPSGWWCAGPLRTPTGQDELLPVYGVEDALVS
jgi:hypothetical protein